MRTNCIWRFFFFQLEWGKLYLCIVSNSDYLFYCSWFCCVKK